jgi:hypothetical protein
MSVATAVECQKPTYAVQQRAVLLDDLVGAGEQRLRHGESPGCLQQLFQLFDRFGVLRADWRVVAAGIGSL